MADPDFTEIYHRVDRAGRHRAEMVDRASSRHDGQPIRTTFEMSDGAIRVLAQARASFPFDVPLAFSDWAHQLRAALDAILYQIAVSDSGQSPPPSENRLQFPLETTRSGFDRITRKQLRHLSPASLEAIERSQPYNIPTQESGHSLWWLHEVARIDRHRLAHEFAWNVRGLQLNFPGLGGAQIDDCDRFLTYITHSQTTTLATITPPQGVHPQAGSTTTVVAWPEIPRWHTQTAQSYRQYGLVERMTNIEEVVRETARYFSERAGS